MSKIIFSFSVLLFCSCVAFKKAAIIQSDKIKGAWNTPKYSLSVYTGMEFNKTGAIFYTTGDTILYFSYEIKKRNLLCLTDKNGKKICNNILKLTNDSLIFINLMDDTTRQVYVKKDDKLTLTHK
jgi:hypothetical protein